MVPPNTAVPELWVKGVLPASLFSVDPCFDQMLSPPLPFISKLKNILDLSGVSAAHPVLPLPAQLWGQPLAKELTD